MQDLIEIAAAAAQELESEYSGSPKEEFLIWLQIALEREAMVSEAYGASFVDSQLRAWQNQYRLSDEVVQAVRRALMAVWAQETAHQSYFKAVLKQVCIPETLVDRMRSRLRQVFGQIQGRLLGEMTSQNAYRRHMAQMAIVLGTTVAEVPEYVQHLQRLEFSEFCLLNADLETTAVAGYERMISLARQISDSDIIQETTVLVDLRRTGTDERYHESLFRNLGNWPPSNPDNGSHRSSLIAGATASAPAISLDHVHALILESKRLAYGDVAFALTDVPMTFDLNKIAVDPFVILLREYAAHAADEGEEPKLMSAGA